MSTAKDEIFARIRHSLRDVPTDVPIEKDAPVAWKHAQPVDVGGDIVEVFAERVADYKATVVRCKADQIEEEIKKALAAIGVKNPMVCPPGLEKSWMEAINAAGIATEVDNPDKPFTPRELNDMGGVITAACVGSAETGTIMLDHSADQGRRALTLVPDVHICIVRTDQVVSSVPEAVARLKPSAVKGQPITWISGPSATSDIELSRVEGVHGPRTLYVIIAG